MVGNGDTKFALPRRAGTTAAVLLSFAGAALLWSMGCSIVNAPSDETFDGFGGQGATSAGGGGGGGQAGSGQAGQGGVGGSGAPCPSDCTALTDQCNQGVCNQLLGQCQAVPVEDGTGCEDGQFCTAGDGCVAGTCVAGDPNTCGIEPDPCLDISCDEGSQTCSSTPLQDGTACIPLDLCQLNAICGGGQCTGTPKDCSQTPVPDECHVPGCDPVTGDCQAVPGNEGDPCVDPNDLCTENQTCSAGVCQGGTAIDCSALTQGCLVGACEQLSGNCIQQPAPDNTPCDDPDPCMTGESCQAGWCTGVLVTTCQSGDNCCPGGCVPANDTECAILDFDVGPYGSTYSSTLTRGLWFTAPVAFTIVGLRVPTDVGTDVQNIEVLRFNSPVPPLATPTNDFVSLGYYRNVPGTGFISVNIPVQAGQIIGIFGARGTATLNNSYSATSPYTSSIGGQPVQLNRLGFQDNLYNVQAYDVWTEAGAYARVEMQYHL